MKKYLTFILFILLIPAVVNAQSLLTKWLNIPEEWTRPPELVYFVFIPFLGTFAIIWGILTATRVRIFEKPKVNILLSFIFALALFYFNILPQVVFYLLAIGGFFGVIVFFILFFVLTILFGGRKIERSYLKTMEIHEKITKQGIEDTIKTRKKELNKIEKIERKEKELKENLNRTNKAILASNEHIRIIRDPTTTARQLMNKYGTDSPRGAERKVLMLLNRQKYEKIHLERRLRELERIKGKLQNI